MTEWREGSAERSSWAYGMGPIARDAVGADGAAVRRGCDEPALGGLSGRIRASGKGTTGRRFAGQGRAGSS